MSWLQRHQIKLFLRNSIWVFPLLSIIAGLAAVRIINAVELAMGLRMDISLETARAVMGLVAASMFTLVVVVSSAVLVAVQLASAQLTPRIISMVYRNRRRKFALAVFVFTFTFSVAALVRMDNHVPLLTSSLAAYGFLINLAFFLFFIDGIGKAFRPGSILRAVALEGREVIRTVYPQMLYEEDGTSRGAVKTTAAEPTLSVFNSEDGVVLAFDLKGLVLLAQRTNCLIEFVPQVGDYVTPGDPLFHVYSDGPGSEVPSSVAAGLVEQRLRDSVAVDQERTFEQDPMFAFRIMVDVASKALSPAINDPTTAVLAIDQIHHLLREVGNRHLADGKETDGDGVVRFVYRTPDWEDFVRLALTELRHYGRDSIQVVRRLRAMLENLIETLPVHRSSVLQNELILLQASSKRTFLDADDRTLAETGDLQGIGGVSEENHQQVQTISVGG